MDSDPSVAFDGFRAQDKDANVAFSPRFAARFFGAVDRISRTLHIEVAGVDNLPEGGALLVANHAFGWDVVFAMAAVRRERHRQTWVLGEHAWWKVPVLRLIASRVGAVDGTQENVDRLLERGELVLDLPGGLREAVKPRELRYRLLWGHRYGFVRAAIRNQVPIVPLACFGADDLFDFVGNAYRRGERVLRRSGIPLPLPLRLLPIPHLVRLHYVIGEPIPMPPRETENDAGVQRRVRREVEGALHELIETELAQRAGVEV